MKKQDRPAGEQADRHKLTDRQDRGWGWGGGGYRGLKTDQGQVAESELLLSGLLSVPQEVVPSLTCRLKTAYIR